MEKRNLFFKVAILISSITLLSGCGTNSFANNVSNRVLFIEDGKIIEDIDSKSFFENPKNDRIKQFIKNINERI